jgi:NADH:ubiquinone oxidoreductase subunit 5 (subunit L)/multisubunit Na+/H+ antiporter MnhA subunit
VLAVAALPPFNGFLSEWFLYRGFFASILGGGAWPAGLALGALALTGGLAGVAFARFFGFLFLGLPRSAAAREAHDPPLGMAQPMAILSGLCLALSLGGILLLPLLDRVVAVVAPGSAGLLAVGLRHDLGLFAGLAALLVGLGAGAWLWIRRGGAAEARPGTWDCGYAQPTARMQYTSSSFADGWALLMPGVRTRMRRIRELFPRPAAFGSSFLDAVGEGFVAHRTSLAALRLQRFRRLQQGHLSMYLLYILMTLVGIFLWMMLRPRLLG